MKIALGSRPYDGPWGGGNRFIASICEGLRIAGHTVVHELRDRDIDFIVLIDPRTRSPNVCFGAGAILRYLSFGNPNAIAIHRVNECDERKGEAFINAKLARANYAADVTVFVGEWLGHLPVWQKNLRAPWFTIRNGADTAIFNSNGFIPWSGSGLLKLVTHHWGYHPMKGFDIYSKLDRMLGQPEWKDKISFTYVGNIPKGFSFSNARHVKPLDGVALADELRSHHAYITGSINEPGGNHQNEGALCGLPLIYRNSGCMPEYCEGFGISFEGPQDVERAIDLMFSDYENLVTRMPQYPHTAARMTREWLDLFDNLARKRNELVGNRKLWRQPMQLLLNQLPL